MNPEGQSPIDPEIAEGMRLRAKEFQAQADLDRADDGSYETTLAQHRAEAARLIHERLESGFDDEPADFESKFKQDQKLKDIEVANDDLRQAS